MKPTIRRSLIGTPEEVYAERTIRRRISRGKYIEATAKLYRLGNNTHPFFSVTGTYIEDHEHSSCGSIHDLVRKYIPEFAPLCDVHLATPFGISMYYVANTRFFLVERELGALGRMFPHLSEDKIVKMCNLYSKWCKWAEDYDDATVRQVRRHWVEQLLNAWLNFHRPIFLEKARTAMRVLDLTNEDMADLYTKFPGGM